MARPYRAHLSGAFFQGRCPIAKLVEARLEKEVDGIVYLTEDYNDPVQDLIDESMTRTIRLGNSVV